VKIRGKVFVINRNFLPIISKMALQPTVTDVAAKIQAICCVSEGNSAID
jgi:hypothetical protein